VESYRRSFVDDYPGIRWPQDFYYAVLESYRTLAANLLTDCGLFDFEFNASQVGYTLNERCLVGDYLRQLPDVTKRRFRSRLEDYELHSPGDARILRPYFLLIPSDGFSVYFSDDLCHEISLGLYPGPLPDIIRDVLNPPGDGAPRGPVYHPEDFNL
jgi:hypothetical protein